jgi:glucokinase
MLLAADVGGTKTLVGLYKPQGIRPLSVATQVYATLDFDNLSQIFEAFLQEVGRPGILAACAGVAGPVEGLKAKLTNGNWSADLGKVSADLGGSRVALLNDLESMAYSVSVLESDELVILQAGAPNATGNAALIAAGTGVNESHIQLIDGHYVPSPAEAGHTDFAARNARELAFAESIIRVRGRVEVEDILSGPGIVNLFRFTHQGVANADCPVLRDSVEEHHIAAEVTATALAGTCRHCVDALNLFVDAYGAESGNLALRSMAMAGVYIGGGIGPKILPALQQGRFMKAFLDKGLMQPLLTKVPVKVILNSGAGLVGASVKAASLLRTATH